MSARSNPRKFPEPMSITPTDFFGFVTEANLNHYLNQLYAKKAFFIKDQNCGSPYVLHYVQNSVKNFSNKIKSKFISTN